MRCRTTAIACLMALAMPPGLLAEDQEVPAKPVVKVCVDSQGNIASAEIAESSNFPEIDAAALKVAQATRFKPGPNYKPGKKSAELSCVKFRVKFVVRDGQLVVSE